MGMPGIPNGATPVRQGGSRARTCIVLYFLEGEARSPLRSRLAARGRLAVPALPDGRRTGTRGPTAQN
eukprot:5920792-Prymnesium_polylepis.1